MKRGERLFSATGIFLVLGIALSSAALAQSQKIVVISKDAGIFARPDAASRVIEKPAVGTVFEATKKIGEWFEIRLASRLGVAINGYIHERQVEIEKPKAEPQKEPEQPAVKTEPKTTAPVQPAESRPARKRKSGSISAGGLFLPFHVGHNYKYSWSLYQETATFTDNVRDESSLGFHLGFGVFLSKRIEIAAGVRSASKTLKGEYTLDWPNVNLFSDIAFAEDTASPKASEFIFNLGLNFHLSTEGIARPYLGGGMSYVNGKVDLLSDITYNETFYTNKTHDLVITGIKYDNVSVNKLGFYIAGGLDFAVTDSVLLYAEGQYIVAKKKVPHPLATRVAGKGENIDVDLGGASAVIGVKLQF